MNTLVRLCAVSLAGALALSSAEARILAFGTLETGFNVGALPSAIPLRENGTRAVTFRTARDNTTVAVTYNAECTAASDHLGDHVEVWITIDGISQPQDFNFCSAFVRNHHTHIAASRRAVVRVAKAGLHTVRVFAKLSPGASVGFLDDSSIVVED